MTTDPTPAAPESLALPTAPGPAPSRARVPALIAASALLHVAVLGASAMMQPKPPPPPREVDVVQWEAVTADGTAGWRSLGARRARVRSGDAQDPRAAPARER